MALSLDLSLRQKQKLVMTPQLYQAIKILQKTTLELRLMVQQEVLQNPVLEEVEDIQEDRQEDALSEEAPDREEPEPSNDSEDIDWRELTITPMVQFRYGDFLPYVGARFTDVTTEVNTLLTLTVTGESIDRAIEYESQSQLGMVVGLTWRASSLIMVDAQAQLLNNEQYSIADLPGSLTVMKTCHLPP